MNFKKNKLNNKGKAYIKVNYSLNANTAFNKYIKVPYIII